MAHFPNMGQKKFMENPALSRTNSYGFLASLQNLEETNDTIPRKHPDRRKDERKDRRTLFHRPLPANAGGPINNYTSGTGPVSQFDQKDYLAPFGSNCHSGLVSLNFDQNTV